MPFFVIPFFPAIVTTAAVGIAGLLGLGAVISHVDKKIDAKIHNEFLYVRKKAELEVENYARAFLNKKALSWTLENLLKTGALLFILFLNKKNLISANLFEFFISTLYIFFFSLTLIKIINILPETFPFLLNPKKYIGQKVYLEVYSKAYKESCQKMRNLDTFEKIGIFFSTRDEKYIARKFSATIAAHCKEATFKNIFAAFFIRSFFVMASLSLYSIFYTKCIYPSISEERLSLHQGIYMPITKSLNYFYSIGTDMLLQKSWN